MEVMRRDNALEFTTALDKVTLRVEDVTMLPNGMYQDCSPQLFYLFISPFLASLRDLRKYMPVSHRNFSRILKSLSLFETIWG
jgi:hypothetical protein